MGERDRNSSAEIEKKNRRNIAYKMYKREKEEIQKFPISNRHKAEQTMIYINTSNQLSLGTK